MKKYLFILSLLATAKVQAQTITVNDTLSTGDVTYYFAADTSFTNYDNISGAGVTWDYSNIANADLNGLSKDSVIEISTSAYSSDYPTASYHEEFENGVQTFFSNTTDSVITHGFVFSTGSNDYIIRYNIDPLTSAKFPMALGTTYTDIIDGDAILPTVGTTPLAGSATITADGTGTLLLGINSYNDIIRVKTVEFLSGNIFIIGPVSVTRTAYIYYSPSTSDMPVFIHGEVFADMGASGTIDLKTIWSVDPLTGYAGTKEANSSLKVSLYPNPTSINVTVTSNNATELTIFNAIGKEFKKINNPTSIEFINIENLPKGIYFVQVKNAQQLMTKKLVIK